MASLAGPSNEAAYDYTEGASPTDIDDVLANNNRSRRDSQFNSFYGEDGQGTMFSGPSHSVNPSSVSRMSHIEGRRSRDSWSLHRRPSHDSGASRGRLSRRDSGDSRSSHRSAASKDVSDEEAVFLTDDEAEEGRGRRRRRKSVSPPGMSSVLGNIAHLFGGRATSPKRSRRASISQRSATSIPQSSRISRRTHSRERSEYGAETDEEEERWGYMSDEEDSENATDLADDTVSIPASMEYDSDSPHPRSPTQVLPLLVSDPIFGGEARIDIDTPLALLKPPPPGPPSRQEIHIEDEGTTIHFIGYETILWRDWAWKIGVTLSFGILGLIGHWFPRIWLRWVAREKAFKDLSSGCFVVIEVSTLNLMSARISMICKSDYRDIALFPICVVHYPYPISTVFPLVDEMGPTPPLAFSNTRQNAINSDKDHLLDNLLVVDHRYSRFAVDPRDGLFRMVRFVAWRVPGASAYLRQKLAGSVVELRRVCDYRSSATDPTTARDIVRSQLD
jgi:cation-transporting ATPase 13A2